MLWFVSALPSQGQGRLADRDVPSLVGRDEEAGLYAAAKVRWPSARSQAS